MSSAPSWDTRQGQARQIGWQQHTRGQAQESHFRCIYITLADSLLHRLSQSAFVLVSGRFGDVYGHQNMVFLGITIIIIFSTANAFCTSFRPFVAMRAMTGVGGGILMPNAVAILTTMNAPGRARNFTLAVFAASPPVGAWIGAMLAGVFLQHGQWKWHFITM